jgi:hypothetical protein
MGVKKRDITICVECDIGKLLDFGQRVASNLPSQKPFRHAGGIIRAFEQLGDIPKLPNNPLQRPKSSKRHYSLVISLSKVQYDPNEAFRFKVSKQGKKIIIEPN